MRQLQKNQGFTLIEVLLAVSITVVVAVMSYQGLDSAMKLAERSELEGERIQRLNRVFDILAKDFRQVVPRKVRSPEGDGFVDAFYYNESSLPMLRFSRNGWTNPAPQRFQRSQLQRVNYHYDGEKLTRQSWQMLDRYDDSEATDITLLDKVERVEIRLLQEQADFNSGNLPVSGVIPTKTAWVTQWPVTNDNYSGGARSASVDLPLAIEITLEVEGWGQVKRLFEIVSVEPL